MSNEWERERRRAQVHATLKRHQSTSRPKAAAPVSANPEPDDPATLAEMFHNNLV